MPKGWQDARHEYGGTHTGGGDEDSQRFSKGVDYENGQVDAEYLPALRRILDLFDSKYWLAEPGTRAFYQSYYDFVEYWNRVKHGALPVEVRKYVPQDEDGFAKFLDHLESTLQALQNELRSRKSGSGKWGLTFGGRSS